MTCYLGEGTWWFRIFGYGLWIRPRKLHTPLFSERYGYQKYYYIGPYVIKVLKP